MSRRRSTDSSRTTARGVRLPQRGAAGRHATAGRRPLRRKQRHAEHNQDERAAHTGEDTVSPCTGTRTRTMRRAMRRSGEWKPLSRLYALALQPADELVRRATRGHATLTDWVTGMPVVELDHHRREERPSAHAASVAIPDGERLVVITSNFGQARNPAWYHNLKAHPEALAELDGSRRRMKAGATGRGAGALV